MDSTCTYSPDDNKLRLSPGARLDAEEYAKVKAAGFRWAPKQEAFICPAWSPEAEDVAMEFAGEIDDEDSTLIARAEDRAERFDTYSEKRTAEAERATDAVHAITENIPLGQPILIGHHSERHARRDAQRIENGMRRAVGLWKTADYWTRRAAAAVAHAKYKERPDVRARRIKRLEADLRKSEKNRDHAQKGLGAWTSPTLTLDVARRLAGYDLYGMQVANIDGRRWSAYEVLRPEVDRYADCPKMTLEQVQDVARRVFQRSIERATRWIDHLTMRLAYERGMLGESGYVEPPKRATKAVLPLLNYPGTVRVRSPYRRGQIDEFHMEPMTKAEFAKIHADYKGTRIVEDGTHRVRSAITRSGASRGLVGVFLTDSKQHNPADEADRIAKASATIAENAAARKYALTNNAAVLAEHKAPRVVLPEKPPIVQAMHDSLAAGVRTVSAPALFPTPPAVATRMVAMARIEPGMHILEPSAGTGAILAALPNVRPCGTVTAVEINNALARNLYEIADETVCADFLGWRGATFDRIVMNPPFTNGADIAHVLHARSLLRPGGRLVAIVADGPRQAATLAPLACEWEPLPAGTFSGTGVRSVMLAMQAQS